jgi:ribulose-phosphate 3-epimerase
LGARAGVSLNPATPVGAVQEVLEYVDLVLVMSVNPGFGGQTFIPATRERIRTLAAMTSHFERPPVIEVDGGIDEGTVGVVAEAGATALVAGTYIFGSADISKAITTLRELAEQARGAVGIKTQPLTQHSPS